MLNADIFEKVSTEEKSHVTEPEMGSAFGVTVHADSTLLKKVRKKCNLNTLRIIQAIQVVF